MLACLIFEGFPAVLSYLPFCGDTKDSGLDSYTFQNWNMQFIFFLFMTS